MFFFMVIVRSCL